MENRIDGDASDVKQEKTPEGRNAQFEKYKKPLKINLIAIAAFSALVLIFVITIVFVPIFSINFDSLSEENYLIAETLPGVEKAEEKWLESLLSSGKISDFIMNFSLFDEIKLTFSSLGEAETSYLIFSIFAIVFFVIDAVLAVVLCVKNIAAMLSPDDYVVGQYDEIKSRAESKRRIRTMDSMLISALLLSIIYEIFAVVFSKSFTTTSYSEEEDIVATSFMQFCTGVSSWVAVVIIAAVLAVAAYCIGAYIKSKVKTQILREDYGIK